MNARATRTALIVASVPELTNRTRSIDGIRSRTRSPSAVSSWLGAPKLVPRLAGQPAVYLRNQLLLFKADRRSPGDEAVSKMKTALKSIGDDTLADLAAYFASLK